MKVFLASFCSWEICSWETGFMKAGFPTICDVCGTEGTGVRRVARTYGKGAVGWVE